jgi:hypothetical protein
LSYIDAITGKPGKGYEKIATHRNIDWFDREWVGDYDDRYISSFDGKVSKLVVQAVDDIYDNTTNSTWRRTFIRNVAPLHLRLADWPLNHVDYTRNGKPAREGIVFIPFRRKLILMKSLDWPLICGKWFITCIAITFVVCQAFILLWSHIYNDDRLEHRTVPKARSEIMAIMTHFPTDRSSTLRWLETYWRWLRRRVTG